MKLIGLTSYFGAWIKPIVGTISIGLTVLYSGMANADPIANYANPYTDGRCESQFLVQRHTVCTYKKGNTWETGRSDSCPLDLNFYLTSPGSSGGVTGQSGYTHLRCVACDDKKDLEVGPCLDENARVLEKLKGQTNEARRLFALLQVNSARARTAAGVDMQEQNRLLSLLCSHIPGAPPQNCYENIYRLSYDTETEIYGRDHILTEIVFGRAENAILKIMPIEYLIPHVAELPMKNYITSDSIDHLFLRQPDDQYYLDHEVIRRRTRELNDSPKSRDLLHLMQLEVQTTISENRKRNKKIAELAILRGSLSLASGPQDLVAHVNKIGQVSGYSPERTQRISRVISDAQFNIIDVKTYLQKTVAQEIELRLSQNKSNIDHMKSFFDSVWAHYPERSIYRIFQAYIDLINVNGYAFTATLDAALDDSENLNDSYMKYTIQLILTRLLQFYEFEAGTRSGAQTIINRAKAGTVAANDVLTEILTYDSSSSYVADDNVLRLVTEMADSLQASLLEYDLWTNKLESLLQERYSRFDQEIAISMPKLKKTLAELKSK